jgi:hypothetical protein
VKWQYNARPILPDTNGRKIVVGDGGQWNAALSVAEMEAIVTGNPN